MKKLVSMVFVLFLLLFALTSFTGCSEDVDSAVYTVSYDSQLADIPASPTNASVTDGETVVSLPTAPTKTGYGFAGWFTEINGGGTAFTASTVVTDNVTVYAKWVISYTVTYDSQSATINASPTNASVADGETVVSLPIAPVKTGYTFAGWFTAIDGGGTEFTTNTVVSAHVTVYAKWAINIYTVTYDSQSATTNASPTNQSVTSPATTVGTLPTAPTKTGYAFDGWFTEVNGGGTEFTASTFVSIDIIVYAKWIESGSVWTAGTLPSPSNWVSVTYGNGVFVAVAIGNTNAATSPDGITWTARTLPSSSDWFSVTYGNGVFVAVAMDSTNAATSSDGISWTAGTLPSSDSWKSVTYGNDIFAAVAYNSSVAATSTDGISWTARTLPGSRLWQSVTYGNGVFVAIANGSIAAATAF